MLIELYEGFFVNPELIAVAKATGDKQCALFTAGQSAIDEGFSVPYAVEEVAEQLNDAEAELYADEEEGEREEGDEDA